MTRLDRIGATAEARWVRWLQDAAADDVGAFGGKVAHLARLRAASIPSPDGFALSADAYVSAVNRSGMQRELADAISTFESDSQRVAELGALCRRMISEMTLPDELDLEVRAAYDELTLRRGEAYPIVAVRSSALKEDAVGTSAAGQYDTILGVSGADAILTAIKQCWASLFSEHAIHYRLQHGFRTDQTPMAVGIVELVDARASGVAFSIDPVSGDPERLVIESTFGWGECLVQGRVTPDHFEVARDDLRVLKRRIGSKQIISSWSDSRDRIEERPMPRVLSETASLADDAVSRIAAVLLEIETLMGHSVDIEWVAPKGAASDPVIVQARPETVHRLTSEELAARCAPVAFDPVAFALSQTFGISQDRRR
jgi:pyruvate,water dikinase